MAKSQQRSEPNTSDAQRSYTTPNTGRTFTLRPLNSFHLAYISSDTSGRPKPPVVQVGRGKRRRYEENPDDPGYVQRLKQWESQREIKGMMYVFAKGVADEPSEDELDDLRGFFPNANDSELKYLWVTGLIDDSEAMGLMEAIVGQTDITKGGLNDSAERFPGDGERESDPAVDIQASE